MGHTRDTFSSNGPRSSKEAAGWNGTALKKDLYHACHMPRYGLHRCITCHRWHGTERSHSSVAAFGHLHFLTQHALFMVSVPCPLSRISFTRKRYQHSLSHMSWSTPSSSSTLFPWQGYLAAGRSNHILTPTVKSRSQVDRSNHSKVGVWTNVGKLLCICRIRNGERSQFFNRYLCDNCVCNTLSVLADSYPVDGRRLRNDTTCFRPSTFGLARELARTAQQTPVSPSETSLCR